MAIFVPEKEKNLYGFNLTIYRDATTVETLDKRIPSYSSLFDNPLYRVEFEAQDIKSGRRLKCNIWHAGGDWSNQITIAGDEPECVENAYRELTRMIGKWTPQHQFFPKRPFWFAGILAIPIGFLLLQLVSGFAPASPPSPERTQQAAFAWWSIVVSSSAMFGICPAMWLCWKVRGLFPSVELHCGPEHFWIEQRRRKFWRIPLGILIISPLGHLAFALYNHLSH